MGEEEEDETEIKATFHRRMIKRRLLGSQRND
jgi:hypothetical protein